MSEWIEWNVGTCPVNPGTTVEVELYSEAGNIKCRDQARNLRWSHTNVRGGDIIAYHVIEEENDNVNTPSHYASNNLECIDAIREMLTKEQFKGMLAGNVTKYIWRKDYKGHPLTDLRKARWYLNRLIEEYENDNGN